MKDDDGWIEWHGGECPVPDGTLVDVQLGTGRVVPCSIADCWSWKSSVFAYDIVRYRISKPAEPPKPDTSAEDALWHEYAGKALQGLLACPETVGKRSEFIESAADYADDMLAEAKKRGRV